MLKRKIDIINNLFLIFDCCDKLIGDSVRITVKKSYPLDAVNFTKLVKKLGELELSVKIKTVACCILCDNDKLLDTDLVESFPPQADLSSKLSKILTRKSWRW